jgi:hypothetical protein
MFSSGSDPRLCNKHELDDMVIRFVGLGPENYCFDEEQQQL